ncbi:hypothetical protein Q664_45930 [Archangium violaceum Cb vi76]|uniref:3'-phosphate/5'-hydroxy nucleic acid ligase n=1 Tax=Archangium violaceum Cb vi76 TaxID=1406225 RepID=A0A084SGY5_9BACT|nr:hypothetical protein Q664_45930 [Archangium violaceum Cb vi76]
MASAFYRRWILANGLAEAALGRTLLVHRKGAVELEAGQRGVIPGSMGTASYVVEGRGEARSFRSCSHGAGRVAHPSPCSRAEPVREAAGIEPTLVTARSA